MSNEKETEGEGRGHLFTVEILMEGKTNGQALEKLMNLLNSGNVVDYRIIKGMELGRVIEAALNQAGAARSRTAQPEAAKKPASVSAASPAAPSPLIEQLERCRADQRLVRLSIVKGKGVKLSVPCRILSYDERSSMITVYHVDEKKVYLYNLNEIDDLT